MKFIIVLIGTLLFLVQGYLKGDMVPLYANKVGPYDNPDESYPFDKQTVFCQPEERNAKVQHLGENLEGDSKTVSIFQLKFNMQVKNKDACEKQYTPQDIQRLKEMIQRNFYYEFEYDDIPIHGFVGKYQLDLSGKERYYLFTHYQFIILYNPNSGVVIFANLTRDLDSVVILEDTEMTVEYKYSVLWVPVDVEYDDRDDVFTDHFFTDEMYQAELEIHWLSIINSLMLVFLLVGFVLMILIKTLNRDYARYASLDKDETEYGWKLVAGDVFRFPKYSNLFCSLVGVGTQFLVMAIFTLLLSLVGTYYPGNDGAMKVSSIVLYALTAAISGYVSSSWYKTMNDNASWPWNIILTGSVFALPFLIMAFFVNIVASVHQVTKALPLGTIITVLVIWLFVGVPLTVIGGITAKNITPTSYVPPVRPKNFPREIPYIPWYRSLLVQFLLSGFLPFSAIYIELHYVFHSIWARGAFQFWGILCLVFVILILVTGTTIIALTYFQLSMEDYRWWWASFLSGGSTGFFIFMYSIFYYVWRSRMNGFLQACFYFGYQWFICYFFFLMLGSVGFYSAYYFVKRIYKNLHTD